MPDSIQNSLGLRRVGRMPGSRLLITTGPVTSLYSGFLFLSTDLLR